MGIGNGERAETHDVDETPEDRSEEEYPRDGVIAWRWFDEIFARSSIMAARFSRFKYSCGGFTL